MLDKINYVDKIESPPWKIYFVSLFYFILFLRAHSLALLASPFESSSLIWEGSVPNKPSTFLSVCRQKLAGIVILIGLLFSSQSSTLVSVSHWPCVVLFLFFFIQDTWIIFFFLNLFLGALQGEHRKDQFVRVPKNLTGNKLKRTV